MGNPVLREILNTSFMCCEILHAFDCNVAVGDFDIDEKFWRTRSTVAQKRAKCFVDELYVRAVSLFITRQSLQHRPAFNVDEVSKIRQFVIQYRFDNRPELPNT